MLSQTGNAAAGGGAPTNATYITQTADGTLSNEQALGALATGILKNTTTTGVLSIAAAGTDYAAAPSGTGLVRNNMAATELSGDVTTSGSNAVTVTKINGTALSGLATGILKNTTTTGVPSIAVAGTDYAAAPSGTGLLRNGMAAAELSGDATTSGSNVVTLAAQYKKLSCQPGLGDGLNAIPAGTYLQTTCYNDTGVTVTITGIKCFTDNSGTSTLNATNGAATALLTGAVTCSSSFAAGTQSGTTTIASGDFIKFTFVADGTSKQATWVVTSTY
jgi:hypothetical protein